ncbi:hypothetical protein NYA8BAC_01747 [Psychrobacter okhotskensis]|jgi:hypothetical protein
MTMRVILLLGFMLLISFTYDIVSSSIENIKKSDPTNRSYENAYFEVNSDVTESVELRLINI